MHAHQQTLDTLIDGVRAGAFTPGESPDGLSCRVLCPPALEPRDQHGKERWLELAAAAIIAEGWPDAAGADASTPELRGDDLAAGRYALASWIGDRRVHVVGGPAPLMAWGDVAEHEIAAGALALYGRARQPALG